MLKEGNHKKTWKNPSDPARFIGKEAVTKDGEMANVLYYLDEEKIAEEARYDGFYAVCTDLFEDSPEDILKVSEGRWQIEACFLVMKSDLETRPVYVNTPEHVTAHLLVYMVALNKWKVDRLPGDLYRFMDADDPDLKLILDAFGISLPAKLYHRVELKHIKTEIEIFM